MIRLLTLLFSILALGAAPALAVRAPVDCAMPCSGPCESGHGDQGLPCAAACMACATLAPSVFSFAVPTPAMPMVFDQRAPVDMRGELPAPAIPPPRG